MCQIGLFNCIGINVKALKWTKNYLKTFGKCRFSVRFFVDHFLIFGVHVNLLLSEPKNHSKWYAFSFQVIKWTFRLLHHLLAVPKYYDNSVNFLKRSIRIPNCQHFNTFDLETSKISWLSNKLTLFDSDMTTKLSFTWLYSRCLNKRSGRRGRRLLLFLMNLKILPTPHLLIVQQNVYFCIAFEIF